MTQTLASTPSDGKTANPLRVGLKSDRIREGCSMAFFGASGDLFKRMLLPAIYELRRHGILPTNFSLIGFARSKYTDDQFRAYCKENLEKFSYGAKPEGAMWDDFAKSVRYISADFNDVSHFHELKHILEENATELKTGNHLFYLATPPSIFPKIVEQLDAAGLSPKNNATGWTRIVIEKPFGIDLESARALQTEVAKVFDETQVYRIDHYLGKEPVQDIMALRFANVIFEPIWNRNFVDSVQITSAETLGVEDRGSYYDNAGALRDMIQNHVMNLLALVAMEPPATNSADAIRNEKYKVLASIQPPPAQEVEAIAVRGQYSAGLIDGQSVLAYRSEPNVAPDSNTETYAAVRLNVQNWRWAGVPFYLRSGKRLARKVSEIAVTFKSIPHRLYGEQTDTIEPNVLVIKIQPDEGISLRFEAKVPGQKHHIRSVSMDFNYGSGFGVESPPAYERLIADAMRGDQTLFTRWDAVERAWEIITPILEKWLTDRDPNFPNYPAGSQGPEAARRLFPGWRTL